jgi:hypothetical protein
MGPKGSLPHLQVPATSPYNKPAWSSPYLHFPLPENPVIIYNIIVTLSSHLRLGLPRVPFPSGFPTKTLYIPLLSPIRATLPAHLTRLDFITQTILGEENEYRDTWVPVTTAWRVLRLRKEERPPMRRGATNILNKQSSSLGVGRCANNISP